MCKTANIIKSLIASDEQNLQNLVGVYKVLGVNFTEEMAPPCIALQCEKNWKDKFKSIIHETVRTINFEEVAVRLSMRAYRKYKDSDPTKYKNAVSEFNSTTLRKKYPSGIDSYLMEWIWVAWNKIQTQQQSLPFKTRD